VTGAGIQLVTVWQSKAQLDQTYHQQADTVLTNHRTKLIYPSGLSDLSTVQYVSDLIGDEHIRNDLDDRSSWLAQSEDRPSGRAPAAAIPFLPASVLRRAQVGDLIVVHGNLPPAWIRARAERTARIRVR
jgi:type IV secretion system protein VirD4